MRHAILELGGTVLGVRQKIFVVLILPLFVVPLLVVSLIVAAAAAAACSIPGLSLELRNRGCY